jgi:hypothetical protein
MLGGIGMTFSKEKFIEIENSLTQLEGIASCKFVLDNDGKLVEIHVLAHPTRTAKQVVRDVESFLLVKFNLPIDHKIISVAQVKHDEINLEKNRVKIKEVKVSHSGMTSEAFVNLEYEGNCYSGEVKGTSTARNKVRMIVQATLLAVETCFTSAYTFTLEDIQQIHIAGKQGYAVAISLVAGGYEDILLGAALTKSSESEAIVKATLNAVNRILSKDKG